MNWASGTALKGGSNSVPDSIRFVKNFYYKDSDGDVFAKLTSGGSTTGAASVTCSLKQFSAQHLGSNNYKLTATVNCAKGATSWASASDVDSFKFAIGTEVKTVTPTGPNNGDFTLELSTPIVVESQVYVKVDIDGDGTDDSLAKASGVSNPIKVTPGGSSGATTGGSTVKFENMKVYTSYGTTGCQGPQVFSNAINGNVFCITGDLMLRTSYGGFKSGTRGAARLTSLYDPQGTRVAQWPYGTIKTHMSLSDGWNTIRYWIGSDRLKQGKADEEDFTDGKNLIDKTGDYRLEIELYTISGARSPFKYTLVDTIKIPLKRIS